MVDMGLHVLPRMLPRRFTPSMHEASRRPLPSILTTCAYSWPSSLKTSSRFSLSASFLPLRLFLPPCFRPCQLFSSLALMEVRWAVSLPPGREKAPKKNSTCGGGVKFIRREARKMRLPFPCSSAWLLYCR